MHMSLPVFGDSCLRCLGKLEKLTSPEPQAHADPVGTTCPCEAESLLSLLHPWVLAQVDRNRGSPVLG